MSKAAEGDPKELGFETLRRVRHELREYLRIHHCKSMSEFKVPEATGWFKHDAVNDYQADQKTSALGNISTSATCIESLLSANPVSEEPSAIAFADSVFTKGPWHSDGAAAIFCPARTLPVALRYVSDFDSVMERATAFLREIWGTVEFAPLRHGVREVSSHKDVRFKEFPWNEKGKRKKKRIATTDSDGYPSNAFHTYWALRSLDEFRKRSSQNPPDTGLLDPTLQNRILFAWAWCRGVLTLQTTLHEAQSQSFDGDQLGWALAVRMRWGHREISNLLEDSGIPVDSPAAEERDLIRAGLDAFFSAQLIDGRWPHFAPLFHYPSSGNAHCYFFETLAEIIRPSLAADAFALRSLLRPHLMALIKTWNFAEETAIELPKGGRGWCSGHHPQRTRPEGWATASVYTYLQNLRKLVGIETDRIAGIELHRIKPSRNPIDARKVLHSRGETWQEDSKTPSVGELLSVLFINPITANYNPRQHTDPDFEILQQGPLIGDIPIDWARSAMLFGPPGTSKTFLVRALAESIGWDLVVIHASEFLTEGIDQIPAVAERLFSKLQELHRTVVLFDEIEEVLRDRNDESTTLFGRFLTTLMLPKLAALWNQRRVIFFVNTNLIDTPDEAIKRSERFDALILVETPSIEVKQKYLTERGIASSALANGKEKLALIRYDQLPELASRLGIDKKIPVVIDEMVPEANKRIEDLIKMRKKARRDYRAHRLVLVHGEFDSRPTDPEGSELEYHAPKTKGTYFRLIADTAPTSIQILGRQFQYDGFGSYVEIPREAEPE